MPFLKRFLLVAMIGLPVAGAAQSRTAIAIGAGPSIPMSKFRDTQSSGTAIDIALIRGSDDSPIGLRFDFGYDRLKGKSVKGVTASDKRIVSGTAELVISSAGHLLKPYLLAGGGAYKLTAKPALANEKLRFGYNVGLGFTLPLASRAFFVESRMNVIPQTHAAPVRYLPIIFGMLF